MYLDDQMSGWRFENNTFDDCDTALFIGGGRSTVATGNTFSNCNLAVHLDNRGMNVPRRRASRRRAHRSRTSRRCWRVRRVKSG